MTAFICILIWGYSAWFDYFKQGQSFTAVLDIALVFINLVNLLTGIPVSNLAYGLAIVKIVLIGMIFTLDSRL